MRPRIDATVSPAIVFSITIGSDNYIKMTSAALTRYDEDGEG